MGINYHISIETPDPLAAEVARQRAEIDDWHERAERQDWVNRLRRNRMYR